MKPVIVELEHMGAYPTVEDQASSGMMVGGLNGSLRGGALPSLAGGFFFARSTKNFIRISCGFFSRSSPKRSSELFSVSVESTLMEASPFEEAIAKKSIDANTFHHTMENNIRIKHQRYNMKGSRRTTLIDTLSRIYGGHSRWWWYIWWSLSHGYFNFR